MQNICVYCGSNPGNSPAFLKSAKSLARALTKRGLGLVYGGASVGIMGAIADEVLDGGGAVTGIIPHALAKKELAHEGLTELVVVNSMHERKAMMAEKSSGFIALPGGLGTLEEIFEVLTWAQLGFHNKPCGLLNVEGYYDYLCRFLDHSVAQGFVGEAHQRMLLVDAEPDSMLDRMAGYEPPVVNKWIELEDI